MREGWFDLTTTELYGDWTSVLIDVPPMISLASLLLGFYFTILACLSVYGLHRCYLVYLYTKHRRRAPVADADMATSHVGGDGVSAVPFVTVQLPVFNEMYVVERLIESVVNQDYPSDRFEVQVLDDSTDATRMIARAAVDAAVSRGFEVTYIHRAHRTGFKAGALAAGLRHARGDLVAIFDADFLPRSDFLSQVVPAFRDPGVGMVQARWEHLNRDYSLLTRVQAMLLDAHFVLEHGARNRAGLFFNFNGTAGVWRREAIESVGGWHSDTLTEDLDLSYRAQLAGWRFVFLPDVVAPAELPVEMNAFRAQQHRWARGSIQTGIKLLPAVFRASLPFRIKMEAAFHLFAHLNFPLLLALAVVVVPAVHVRAETASLTLFVIDLPLFLAATLSVVNFYAVSQREVRSDWVWRLWHIPVTMAVAIGLSVQNTFAVLGARRGRSGTFLRTPKYGVIGKSDEWLSKRYRLSTLGQPWAETGLGLYFTAAVFYAASKGLLVALPFLCLFQAGFLFTGLLTLLQQRARPDVLLRTQVARD